MVSRSLASNCGTGSGPTSFPSPSEWFKFIILRNSSSQKVSLNFSNFMPTFNVRSFCLTQLNATNRILVKHTNSQTCTNLFSVICCGVNPRLKSDHLFYWKDKMKLFERFKRHYTTFYRAVFACLLAKSQMFVFLLFCYIKSTLVVPYLGRFSNWATPAN